jgi:DNA-directed RNA polymerase subunit RPC12/RpoP
MPRTFIPIGIAGASFQGGYIILAGFSCSTCGRGFWVEEKNVKGLDGYITCPHCRLIAIIDHDCQLSKEKP